MDPPPIGEKLFSGPRGGRRKAKLSQADVADDPKLLGQLLVRSGAVTPGDLLNALSLQKRQHVPLGEILLANGALDEPLLLHALAAQQNTYVVDLLETPPDPALSHCCDPTDYARLGFIPWQSREGALVIAICDPANIAHIRLRLPAEVQILRFVIASKTQIHHCIQAITGHVLAHQAEHRTAPAESCRNWSVLRAILMVLKIAGIAFLCLRYAPVSILYVLLGVAMMLLVLNTAFRVICMFLALSGLRLPARRSQNATPDAPRRHLPPEHHVDAVKLPKISVLVPLVREDKIVPALIARLRKLNYPRELLEICIVVEADDKLTQNVLRQHQLPAWMQIIEVPRGQLKTKPRAMNYALDFTSGSIIGVYDAEDAPDPEQLFHVADKFSEGGPELACVQGVLSFYNHATSWISRCFFFEYAAWFRVMLPGYTKLGFAIPLGGTTLFFRRDILLKLGAWDAHNVTEDADLGMRLARHGYRCDMMASITHEEANSRIWPWIKQRSRWLKGYAVTWSVHMRNPIRLWHELGAWKFLGFQLVFLNSLVTFFLAPVLWWCLLSFATSLPNPVIDALSGPEILMLSGVFITTEVLNLSSFVVAVRKVDIRPNRIWVATLPVYFMLGTFAAYKGLSELLFKPFYWDKTEHGKFGGKELHHPHPRHPANI